MFNHPWETVAQAAWRKYPNPITTSIIGTDVVERKVDEHGVLHTHRVVSSKWYFPKWAQALIGTAHVCYANERSTVDPKTKNMTLQTNNITFGRYIAVDEVLRYIPHPTDPTKTLLRQEATVVVDGVPLNHYMEDMLTKTISLNAGKGRQGLEWVINKINTEVNELTTTAVKSTEELFSHTRKVINDTTDSARKSMDELSTQTQKIRF